MDQGDKIAEQFKQISAPQVDSKSISEAIYSLHECGVSEFEYWMSDKTVIACW